MSEWLAVRGPEAEEEATFLGICGHPNSIKFRLDCPESAVNII